MSDENLTMEFAGTILRRDRVSHFQFKTARNKTVSIIIKWHDGANKGEAVESNYDYVTGRNRYDEIRKWLGDL